MDITVTPITAVNLFRLETYVDRIAGTIFRQIPVTETGERDPMRQELFGGSCHIFINGRQVPINFPIDDATSLTEAIEKFAPACQACIQAIHDQQLRSKILSGGGAVPNSKPVSTLDLSKTRKGN
jgi:hypothetical protein